MSTYRLLSGPGEQLETFEAADDQAAEARGRELTAGHPQPPAHDSGQAGEPALRADFRIERRDGDRWSLVHAWVPLPPTPIQDC